MDSLTSGKRISSSSSGQLPSVSNPSLSGAGETDENVLTKEQINSMFHNKHKEPVTKHFMSPTVSAASKSSTRGKNILGERNEAESPTCNPIRKSPSRGAKTNQSNPSSQSSRRSSFGVSSQSCGSGPNGDENKSSFVADSPSNQYDPLTNYLSPRPKYLRYKPNRRHEILLQLENRGGEGDDGFGLGVERNIDCKTKAINDDEPKGQEERDIDDGAKGEKGNMQEENDEILKKGDSDDPQPQNDEILEDKDGDDETEVVESELDEDEEEGEYVKENSWSFNWLSTLLLLMAILILSPLFVSLMKHPLSSPTEPVTNGFDDICPMNRSLTDSQNKIEVSSSSLWGLDKREVGFELVDEAELADKDEIFSRTSNELVEVSVAEIWHDQVSDQELEKEPSETGIVADNEAEGIDQHHSVNEMEKEALGKTERHDDAIPNAYKLTKEPTETGIVGDNEAEAIDQHHSVDEMENKALGKTERHDDAIPNAYEHEDCVAVVEELDQMKDENEVVSVDETSSEVISLQEEIFETQMGTDEDTYAIPNAYEHEDCIAVVEELDQMKDENEVVSVDEPSSEVKSLQEEIFETQMGTDEDTYADSDDEIDVTSNSDDVVKFIYSKIQLRSAAFLPIVFILPLISAYAIYIFSTRKSRTSSSVEHSKPVAEQQLQVPNVDGKNECTAELSPLFSPIEKGSIPSADHRYNSNFLLPLETPTKQSPIRSAKDSSQEFSQMKTLEVELLGELVIGEVSSSLRTSVGKTRRRLLPETTEVSSSHSFADVSGSSRFHSAEKKLIKTQEHKDGEAKKKEIPTPVRRSSRIRNRSVMSP